MTDNTEALRLANALENLEATGWGGDCFALTDYSEKQANLAAAELRRLHADNERLKATLAASCDDQRQEMWEAGPGGGCVRALEAESVNEHLVSAAKQVIAAWEDLGRDAAPAIDALRAAIKKAEGKE